MKVLRTSDYELIARLNQPVQDVHFSFFPKYFKAYNYEDIKSFFKGIINNENYIFLLLEDDQEYIGYAWVEMISKQDTVFKRAYQSVYIHQMSINKANRKQGYGEKMLEEVYAIAQEKEIDLIELDYWSLNSMAANFYKKHGFARYREYAYKDLSKL